MFYKGFYLWGFPKKSKQGDSALGLLEKQFVSAEITKEEYEARKKVLENIIRYTNSATLWNRTLSSIMIAFFVLLLFVLLSEQRMQLYDFLPLIVLAIFAIALTSVLLWRARHNRTETDGERGYGLAEISRKTRY